MASVTERGSGGNNTGATTLVINPSGTLAAGSMGVLVGSVDNAGASGSAAIAPASVVDSKGNTWTRRRNPIYDPGAASAGVEIFGYTAPITVALLVTDNITITWGGATLPVAKRWALKELVAGANEVFAYRTGGDGTGAASGTPTMTTASITSGEIVVAWGGAESSDTWAGDADSTNGAWSTHIHGASGTGTSGIALTAQHKIVTGTATQTYNPTLTSADQILGYMVITVSEAHSGSVVATGAGVAVTTARKAAAAAITGSGGGVAVLSARKTGQVAVTGSGGGVAVIASSAARQSSVTATGGGVATVTYDFEWGEPHFGSTSATGGGVATVAISTTRDAALVASASGVAAVSGAKAAMAAVTATGAGEGIAQGSGAHAGSAAGTGGGSASLSVRSARLAAALMSGGGVMTEAHATERFGDVEATGGGSAVVSGSSAESHSGSVSATGGGTAGLAATTGRGSIVGATGAGEAAIAALTERIVALLVSGGGSGAVGVATERFVGLIATGGGGATITAGQAHPDRPANVTAASSVVASDAADVPADLTTSAHAHVTLTATVRRA